MSSTDLRDLLSSSYVLFSCEGTAESVVVEKLVEAEALLVPRDHLVDDPIQFTPYTRLRKASDIAERFFRMSYEGVEAAGLLVARIVDSRSARFVLPKRWNGSCEIASFYTRPEIEMLVIHAERAYEPWLRACRRNHGLKPSEFCKGELGLGKIKEGDYLRSYWNPDKLIDAIKQYDSHRQTRDGELSLGALLA